MRGLERRLLKLERGMNGSRRTIQSLSDEELEMRILAIFKQAGGAALSPQEQAVLAIPLQPDTNITRLTDDELNARFGIAFANWLSEGSKAAREVEESLSRKSKTLRG